jgi:predicted sulfurtransferase
MSRIWKTTLTILSLVITLLVIWSTSRPTIVQDVTQEDVVAEARRGGYQLMEMESLRALYQEPSADLLLVDTRQDWEFRAGRIRGAQFFPMEPTWWARFRATDELVALLGPNKERALVFY